MGVYTFPDDTVTAETIITILPAVFEDVPAASAAAPDDELLLLQTDVVVSGAGTSAANGTYTYRGVANGKPYYNLSGEDSDPDLLSILYTGTDWTINQDVDGNIWYVSSSDTDTPYEASGWTAQDGDLPVPTVTASQVLKSVTRENLVDGLAELTDTITNGDTTHAPDSDVVFNALYSNFRTQATAAGTTTLVAADAIIQAFTGATTQTVVLPVTSTLTAGRQFLIVNNSTGIVTVNSSGANLVQTLAPNSAVWLTCVLITGTTAASWDTQVFTPTDSAGRLLVPTAFSATAPSIALEAPTLGFSQSGGTAIFAVRNGNTIALDFGNASFRIPGTYQFGFAAADPSAGGADTGLARVSAALMRVTNGSTGLGRIVIGGSTPASASATGVQGTITWDSDFIYMCVATDTWKRIAILTW